jgi:hypothetical protein
MRHSRSILAAALLLSAAACGQGVTEPHAPAESANVPAPSLDVGDGAGWGGGQSSEDGNVTTVNTTAADSTAITGGSGGRGLQHGGGH